MNKEYHRFVEPDVKLLFQILWKFCLKCFGLYLNEYIINLEKKILLRQFVKVLHCYRFIKVIMLTCRRTCLLFDGINNNFRY